MLTATEARKASVHGRLRTVDEAQRGGESDLEQAADDQPQPGHDNPFTGRMRAACVTLAVMAKPRTIGNMIAPPRFLAFLAVLIVGVPDRLAVCSSSWALGAMAAFDVAAVAVPDLVHPVARHARGAGHP